MTAMSYSNSSGTAVQELRTGETQSERIMANDVRKGMEVYDASGGRIGTVAEIWAHRPGHGYLPRSQTYLNDYGPISGSSAWFATQDGYIEVTRQIAPRLTKRTLIQLVNVAAVQGDYLLVE